MYALGIDIGTSSIKVAVVEAGTGKFVTSASKPKTEQVIHSEQSGWAEQEPEMWWTNFVDCLTEIYQENKSYLQQCKYIGIAYQMHGLVAVNKELQVVRPAIIWCDSRAVDIGNKAFRELGKDYSLDNLLNSPGNFTASKLKWVKENEPESYQSIHKIMLPGDYFAMKLTGTIATSISGLSEGVFWDFKEQQVSNKLLDYYGIHEEKIPDYYPSYYVQATISKQIANELHLHPEAVVSYKAGDQPNNALSLHVLNPGEIAATAGTSGVVYGVSDQLVVDKEQAVNSFAHVNHSSEQTRIGVLLCINGVGIANAYTKNLFHLPSFTKMNEFAKQIEPGSEGLLYFPFGNGAERMLQNRNIQASISGLNFLTHSNKHFCRAVQEGIAYSFAYGLETFNKLHIPVNSIKAGKANLFLSPVFASLIANLANVEVNLYNTDGAIGAARGSLIGAEILSEKEAFNHLEKIETISPSEEMVHTYKSLFFEWKEQLNKQLK